MKSSNVLVDLKCRPDKLSLKLIKILTNFSEKDLCICIKIPFIFDTGILYYTERYN